ncbi:GFA family protein [Pontivivens ytuae]|uniref:GFA family protein n=1 Tax=Pontivivens ytuae TaxID=2789856 RepID=A0A7S9LUW5_9RHOB|nr:GFA family protein [Pontivivens ytuae]QPH55771.1 GFA family protein [Pontivivens ytuae]
MMVGQCLCGEIRISVRAHADAVSACHCSLCRTWSGTIWMGLEAAPDAVTVEGTPRSYRSSSFAERAFCPTCGTQLWLRDDDGPYELMPGLFPGSKSIPLTREVYADRTFAWAALAGEHTRVSATEYERKYPFVEGDQP